MRSRQLVLSMVLLTLGLTLFGCEQAIDVEAITPKKGMIRESFSEQARTRLSDVYVMTLPVDGRIARIELEPGDPVQEGQMLIEYDLVPLKEAAAEARAAVGEIEAAIAVLEDNRLEDTALEETRAVVQATEEALKAADKQVEAQEVLADHSAQRLQENEQLFEAGAISKQQLDDMRLAAETATIELREQQFDRASLKAMMVAVKTGPQFVLKWLEREQLKRVELENQLGQARARLAHAEHRLALADVRSPVSGVVLEKFDDGDRSLRAGEKVLSVGNIEDLEVISDVLTQDAMRLEVGTAVELRPASRFESIPGTIRRVEPQGFTKLSSLGVEQQRVNVIVSLDEPPEQLGVGYRLQATFFTGEKADAMIVPRYSVLQAPDQSYYVYTIANGRIQKTSVEIGLRNDLEMEIASGVNESDQIVKSPDATMEEGASVSVE